MRGFRKEKNMRANPRVTLLAYEQRNLLRSLEVRGIVVEMTEAGALEHLDRLSVKYIGRAAFVLPIHMVHLTRAVDANLTRKLCSLKIPPIHR